jgi:hypothetical protein
MPEPSRLRPREVGRAGAVFGGFAVRRAEKGQKGQERALLEEMGRFYGFFGLANGVSQSGNSLSWSANGVSIPANGVGRAADGACKSANRLSRSGVGALAGLPMAFAGQSSGGANGLARLEKG